MLTRILFTEANGCYLQDGGVVDKKDILCWARDPIDAERLWSLTEDLVSQKFDYYRH